MRFAHIFPVSFICTGIYLVVRAAMLISRCMERGVLSFQVWERSFWFADSSGSFRRLGENGEWAWRVGAGLILIYLSIVIFNRLDETKL